MNEPVARHLRTLGCRQPVADAGRCIWAVGADLFGASHRVEAVWEPSRLTVARTLTPPSPNGDPVGAVESWRLTLAHTGLRWRLEQTHGALFADVSALRDALKLAAGEIEKLGASPRLDEPRRRQRP